MWIIPESLLGEENNATHKAKQNDTLHKAREFNSILTISN